MEKLKLSKRLAGLVVTAAILCLFAAPPAAAIGAPCSQCGPGDHWIDDCGPGEDVISNSSALVGIDLDLDCVVDQTLIMTSCDPPNHLLIVEKQDAVGHTMATEIKKMCYEHVDLGLTLRAGVDQGVAQPSPGAIEEDGVDPAIGRSTFDVFFELDGTPWGTLHNVTTLTIEADITCVPPEARYIKPTGCIELYDDQGVHRWNLVKACHCVNTDCVHDNIGSAQGLTFAWYQDGEMMEVEWYYTYRVDGGAAIGESHIGKLDFRATHPEHDGKGVQFSFFRPPGQNGWRQTIFSYSSHGVSDVYTVGDYPGEWHIPDIAVLLGSDCGDTIFTAVDMNLYGASNPDGFGERGGSVGKNLSGLGVIIVDGQVEGLEGIYWASSEWTLDTTGRSIFKPIGGDGTLLNSADCPDDLVVVAEHVGGILEGGTTCCSGTRGNVDGDANESVNIVDLTFLVSYLFDGGSPPPCWEEADINGDDSVNVADVTSLVDYIFFSGPAPLSCP